MVDVSTTETQRPWRKQIITSAHGWAFPDFGELWAFRELLFTLTFRDIKVRYKQTAIGILWAVIQPVISMVVFTLIFGKLGKLPSNGLPYPAFVLAALLPWQLFAKALTDGSMSMVTMGAMMSKTYFPRLIAPLSSVLSGIVDFAIGLAILFVVMLWYGLTPGWSALLSPLFMLLALAAAFAVSLWLSVINAEYRDVQYALPFLTQIWLMLTPVLYPTSLIPAGWHWLFVLNPMVSVIEGFRWALLGGTSPDFLSIMVSAAATALLLVFGLVYFARFEKSYVDRL
jgi:lipopolysaccharide transport system permease protein